ncbi:MAG: DUF1588 domain-containing protein [Sandaracinus sp.]|nr:DUF1588 domain-containing protein [Sandaracinus sp.]MCB9631919.1 DUF1588 domain-containing protein [Sandaracinus sp.]
MKTRFMVLGSMVLGSTALVGCQGAAMSSPGGGTPSDVPTVDAVLTVPAVELVTTLDGEPAPTDPDYVPTPDEGELSDRWRDELERREVDYQSALRVASMRLRGDLPTLLEIRFLEAAPDQRAAYEAMIDDFLDDPRFVQQLRLFWRDTMKMGGGNLDTAPNFAAQLVVENRPITELFTATEGNCPTFADGAFSSADCNSGAPSQAGVLTDPAVMRHFFSNLAFRRVRWIQETFACHAFPAEVGEATDVGGVSPYTAPWEFESISGSRTTGRVDFHDTSSVICANCHATMNHVAPLVANFDEDGMWDDGVSVPTPLEGAPMAERTDWLPEGEGTAWRFGVPANDLPALGAAMAADPSVHSCIAARVHNWAMGHGDVVDQLAIVPRAVTERLSATLRASGFELRAVIYDAYTSDDFVRF